MKIRTKRLLLGLAAAVLIAVGMDYYGRGVALSPDFTANTLDGKIWTLSDHRGKRPVLLSFYATWCGPCNQEFPHLARLARDYQDRGLQVVIVGLDTADLLRKQKEMMAAPVRAQKWRPRSSRQHAEVPE